MGETETNRLDVRMIIVTLVFILVAAGGGDTAESRDGKVFSIFNVIKFPNTECAGTNSLNGTCYTNTECTSLGGTSSGSCASSFGVCCVFSLACGGSTSANTSYATISTYSTSTDADPCVYKYCKNSDDVCKLRIDYESMVIAGPSTFTATTSTDTYKEGVITGDCDTDTISVGIPGFASPPVICGYNTGQHMWVPASDSCATITLDIDTATTSTTRSWNIRVTQYECGNLMAPEQSCLQYHTAQTGNFASFNWDTSQTSNLKTALRTQYHLSNQYYDICIRRAQGFCSVCFSPQIMHTTPTAIATEGSSFGLTAGSTASIAVTSAMGPVCTGLTTFHATATIATGFGDYITIENIQPGTGTAGALGTDKLCGILFNAGAITSTATATACTFQTPFKVGVHFDADEAIGHPASADNAWDKVENAIGTGTTGEGTGYNGFWLAYWQNTC